jgi:hypothetical protein
MIGQLQTYGHGFDFISTGSYRRFISNTRKTGAAGGGEKNRVKTMYNVFNSYFITFEIRFGNFSNRNTEIHDRNANEIQCYSDILNGEAYVL